MNSAFANICHGDYVKYVKGMLVMLMYFDMLVD